MSNFPLLKTGAFLQYPAIRHIQNSTCVLRFLDGTEQRFRDYPSPARRWTVRLDLLDEAEMAALEEFLISQQGQSGRFSFTDPWEGTTHADCSLEGDVVPLEFIGISRGRSMLVVKENRD
jgi:hypothetical protein